MGYRVPGGTFRVHDYERVISHDAVRAPQIEAPLLHPVWVMLGALRGMGVTLEELLADVGAPQEAVLFGEAEIGLRKALNAEADYRVEGGVTDLVRRQGKRAGPFDVFTLSLSILAQDGEEVAVAKQSFIVLRSGNDGGA